MKFILWLALLKCVLGTSHVSVRLPYRNPAGVTYVEGKASADLVAGPNQRGNSENLTVTSAETSEQRSLSEDFQRYETSQDISTAAPTARAGSHNPTFSPATLARNFATLSGRYVHPDSIGTVNRQPFSYQFFTSSSAPNPHYPTVVRQQPGITQDQGTGSSGSTRHPVVAQAPGNNSARTPPGFSSSSSATVNSTSHPGNASIAPGQGTFVTQRAAAPSMPRFYTPFTPLVGVGYPTYSTVATPTFQHVPVVYPHPSVVAEGFVQSPNIALIPPTDYSTDGLHFPPTISNVPIARVEQGAFSKTIDVAHPAIKTSKYEVRRPAIKKDFYDIEERIIVRPAGSVVLELDHPISQTPKGETIRNYENQFSNAAGNASQGSTLNLEIGTPSENGIISQANQQNQNAGNVNESADAADVDEVDGPKEVEGSNDGSSATVSTPEPFVVSTTSVSQDNDSVVIEAKLTKDSNSSQTAYNNESPPTTPYIPHSRTSLRNFIQYQNPSSGGQPQPVQCTAACQRQARINNQQQGRANLPPFVQNHNTYYSHNPSTNQPHPRPQGVTYYYQQNPQQRSQVPSAEHEGSNSQYLGQQYTPQYYQQSPQPNLQQTYQHGAHFYQQRQSHNSPQPAEYYEQKSASNHQQTDQYERQIAEEQAQVTQVDSEWNSQKNSVPFMVAVGEPDFRYPPYVETSPNFDAKASNKSGQLRVYNEEKKSQQVQQDAESTQSQADDRTETRTTYTSSKYENSPVLTQQESVENQRNYLNLLLARGGVSEVSGRLEQYEPRSGYLRSRVISATPAPFNAPPTGEQVNTRRIVISQPLETVQEVEVQEPVTKYQRLSIKQPVQYKAARVDHATGPIYTRPVVSVHHAAVTYQNVH